MKYLILFLLSTSAYADPYYTPRYNSIYPQPSSTARLIPPDVLSPLPPVYPRQMYSPVIPTIQGGIQSIDPNAILLPAPAHIQEYKPTPIEQ